MQETHECSNPVAGEERSFPEVVVKASLCNGLWERSFSTSRPRLLVPPQPLPRLQPRTPPPLAMAGGKKASSSLACSDSTQLWLVVLHRQKISSQEQNPHLNLLPRMKREEIIIIVTNIRFPVLAALAATSSAVKGRFRAAMTGCQTTAFFPRALWRKKNAVCACVRAIPTQSRWCATQIIAHTLYVNPRNCTPS